MAQDFTRFGETGIGRTSFDAGLRTHMQSVFNRMALGLALTGLMAFLVVDTALGPVLFGTPLRWVILLSPLGFAFYFNVLMRKAQSRGLESISAGTLQFMFWLYCGSMGLSLSQLLMMFTGDSITRTFFITGVMFGATSLYGYTTKRNLASLGGFLFMGVVGLMIASVVNAFMGSSGLQWAISLVGVAVFTGLTAYSVQNIKDNYADSHGTDGNSKLAYFGALQLYISFINIFIYLLELQGALRRD